ncbi:DNA-processing protein DprA [Leucobacter luti]|nr:DNA-processing protein DprA [Leucobacter luti]
MPREWSGRMAGRTTESPHTPELAPERADALLARVVWSRLVEPGDAIAGTLIAALGAEELLALLAAGRAPRMISARAREAGVTELSDRAITAGVHRWLPRLSRKECVGDLDRAIAADMRLLTPGTSAWPEPLDDLGAHAPLVLWVRGNTAHLTAPSLAVVGARACTGYGANITAELTHVAGDAGLTIVSGAAYGIDAVAHRTALAAGHPTIAVLAGGADRIYPSSHRSLLHRIGVDGLVCSELVPGAAPTRWRFLQRNRLIAALSGATLVTEAGLRSGSLNTAGHAASLGRTLGAVPGPVTSAASAGCHRLIREYGAQLVSNEEELRELLDVPRTALADLGAPAGAKAEAELGTEAGSGAETAAGISAGEGTGLGLGAGSEPTNRSLAGVRGTPAEFEVSGGAESGAVRQPAVQQRVIDALPLRGSRSAEDVARRAGIGRAEARGVLAELELLGYVARRETPSRGGDEWGLQRRE